MKKNHILTATGILLFAFISCKKDNTSTNTPPTDISLGITAISPASGGLNSTLTITGKNFKTTPGDNLVKIGGVTVPVTAATSTTLTLSVPQLLSNGGGAVEVTTTGGTVTGPVFTYTPAVYAAGYELNSTGISVAKTWLNGTATSLSSGTLDNTINCMYVSATDILAGGYEATNVKNVPVVWRNGVAATYTSGTGGANINGVTMSGNNVYACGYENTATYSIAKYWLNGTGTNLTSGTTSNAAANAIAVSGSIVYVCGYEVIGGKVRARLWTNGTATTLNNGANDTYAIGIALSGTDVYVMGYEQTSSGERIRVWRNGTESAYANTNGFRDIPKAIYVNGTDVYVSGFESDNSGVKRPKFWKNGVATLLETTLTGEASGVTVCGNDVYVSGFTNLSSGTIGKVYKNGVAANITTGTFYAFPAAVGLR